ncbi:unnamed protein product [Ascophyllum nodosum]
MNACIREGYCLPTACVPDARCKTFLFADCKISFVTA